MRRFVLLPVVLSLFGVGTTAPASASELGGFNVDTRSTVLSIVPTTPGLTVTDVLFEINLGFSQARLDSAPSSMGRASSLWPGEFGAHAPTMLSQFNPALPNLPPWPVDAEARYPSVGGPDARVTSVPGGPEMTTEASEASSRATSSLGTLGVPGVAEFGFAVSESTTGVHNGRATGRSTARLADVSLLAGAIRASSVRSVSDASSDGIDGVSDGGVVVSGLEVAGIPVQVDEQGLRAASSTVGTDTTEDQLRDALARIGVQDIRIETTETVDEAGVERVTTGLLVELKSPAALPPQLLDVYRSMAQSQLSDLLSSLPAEVRDELPPEIDSLGIGAPFLLDHLVRTGTLGLFLGPTSASTNASEAFPVASSPPGAAAPPSATEVLGTQAVSRPSAAVVLPTAVRPNAVAAPQTDGRSGAPGLPMASFPGIPPWMIVAALVLAGVAGLAMSRLGASFKETLTGGCRDL